MTNFVSQDDYNEEVRQEGSRLTVTIYIDQFFFFNFIMDSLLLILVKRLMGIHTSFRRLILGAAAGAGISTAGLAAGLLLGPLWAWRMAAFVAGGIIMVRLAFGRLHGREMVRTIAALCIAASLTAGCIYGLCSLEAFWPAAAFLQGKGTQLTGLLNLGSLFFLTAGTFFAVQAAISFLTKNRERRQRFYDVCLRYRGRECRVKAARDTGNELYEPVSHRPVHILNRSEGVSLAVTVPAVLYIPYQSIGRSGGLLPAIYLDELEVKKDGRFIRIERPLVAIASRPVSPDNEYQMLLHGSFHEEGQCSSDHNEEEKR